MFSKSTKKIGKDIGYCIALAAIAFTITFLSRACGIAMKDDAQIAVESAGNTHVQLGTYTLFRCAKDDTIGWHFKATNPIGKETKGIVCCGVIKGCTVRY